MMVMVTMRAEEMRGVNKLYLIDEGEGHAIKGLNIANVKLDIRRQANLWLFNGLISRYITVNDINSRHTWPATSRRTHNWNHVYQKKRTARKISYIRKKVKAVLNLPASA